MTISSKKSQAGVALVVTMVSLLILLLLGVSLANLGIMNELEARNERDRIVALNAAESALTDAELVIENYESALSLTNGSTHARCASGTTISHVSSVEFGQITGKTMMSGVGPFPAQLPCYTIEVVSDDATKGSENSHLLYRINAIGFGVSANSRATIQSFYRKKKITKSVESNAKELSEN